LSVEIFGDGEEAASERPAKRARPTTTDHESRTNCRCNEETTIPRELISDPSNGALSLPLCTQSELKSERAKVISLWRKHGYLILDVPALVDPMKTLQAATEDFFGLPHDEKVRCIDPAQVYLGYQRRDAFDKELYQVRATLLESQWPTAQLPGLQPAAEDMFQRLSELADLCTESALLEAGVEATYTKQLLEPSPLNRDKVSPTNLTLFRYRVPLGETRVDVHCPYHSDVGLATVIPKSRGPGGASRGVTGLHLFDYYHSCWVDVEIAMSETQVIVFAGEQLQFLTNSFMAPGIHEVSYVNGERFSTPLQRLANPDVTLDNTAGAKATVGEVTCPSRVNAMEFVHHLSASRVSSNYPREVVQAANTATA
jgi:isopenicillin N synthase-like dioxygenase